MMLGDQRGFTKLKSLMESEPTQLADLFWIITKPHDAAFLTTQNGFR